MSNELINIEKLNPLEIFAPGGIDNILDAIKKEANNQVADISTANGRAEIKSLAYKIAQTRSAIDKSGKELADKLNAQLKPINVERRKSKEALELLQAKIRKPLTDYEDKEKNRVAELENRLSVFESQGIEYHTSEEIIKIHRDIEAIPIDASWEEFQLRATDAKTNILAKLDALITNKKRFEDEVAELERLRKEEEARKQKERDERIAEEARQAEEERQKLAIEQAEKEKEEAAQRLIEQELQAEQAKKDSIEQAKKEKAEALKREESLKEQAKKEKEEAVQAEKNRVQAAKEKAEKAEKARAADVEHRRAINNEIIKALALEGLSESDGKVIIKAIVKGHIPNTKITY